MCARTQEPSPTDGRFHPPPKTSAQSVAAAALIVGVFQAAVGVTGEPGRVPWVGGGVVRPGPATEAGFPIIGEGQMDFLLGVHDKWTILGDGFTDGHSLKKQEFACCLAIAQFHLGLGVERQGAFGGHGLAARFNAYPTEIEQAAATKKVCRRQRPGGARVHLDGPDYDPVGRIRGP